MAPATDAVPAGNGHPRICRAEAIGAARHAVQTGIRRYNEALFGPIDHQAVAYTLRQRGDLCGGFIGHVQFGWLFVEMLWVRDDVRGAGHGRALMERGEAEARRRGATKAYLNTFSFQAPGFYAKLGYGEYARLDDFPAGHQRILMTKAL